MKIRNALILPALALTAGFTASQTSAGTITAVTLTDNEAQIVNTGGALVSAVNFGSAANGNSTVDINGIVHVVSSSANQADLDLVSPALVSDFANFDGTFRSGAGYTGDLADLMSGIAGNGSIDMDIFGLTAGTQYLFQAYWEGNDDQVATITFEGTDSLTGLNQTGNEALLITYAFTAGDNTLDVEMVKTAGGENLWLQGYSLQVVPEPASLAMAVVGLAGLCLRRRRD